MDRLTSDDQFPLRSPLLEDYELGLQASLTDGAAQVDRKGLYLAALGA